MKHGLDIGDGIVDEKHTGTESFDKDYGGTDNDYDARQISTKEEVVDKLIGKMKG